MFATSGAAVREIGRRKIVYGIPCQTNRDAATIRLLVNLGPSVRYRVTFVERLRRQRNKVPIQPKTGDVEVKDAAPLTAPTSQTASFVTAVEFEAHSGGRPSSYVSQSIRRVYTRGLTNRIFPQRRPTPRENTVQNWRLMYRTRMEISLTGIGSRGPR